MILTDNRLKMVRITLPIFLIRWKMGQQFNVNNYVGSDCGQRSLMSVIDFFLCVNPFPELHRCYGVPMVKLVEMTLETGVATEENWALFIHLNVFCCC